MDARRLKTFAAAVMMGGLGAACWFSRNVPPDARRHIPAHVDYRLQLGAYFFWFLAFVLALGGLGIITERTMNDVAAQLPRKKRSVVHHHHHHYPSVPPPGAQPGAPSQAPPTNPDGTPQITKWTD